MKQLFLFITLFFVYIWTQNYIIVRWEGIPSGNTEVFCTIDGAYDLPETLELTRITWTNNNQDGEWIAFYPFLQPYYFVDCLRYVNGVPVYGTASSFSTFDSNLTFFPLVKQ